MARRDTKEKSSQQFDDLVNLVPALLDEIQTNIFQRALDFREANTTKFVSYDEF